MTPRQETAAMWDFDQAVGFRSGSCPLWVKAEKLDLSIRCPLCPRKRTLSDTTSMSALCRKQTFALQHVFLFDHLVGRGQQTRRHFKSERPGRPAGAKGEALVGGGSVAARISED